MLNLNINLAKVKDAYIATLENGHRAVVIPDTSVWIPTDSDPAKPVANLSIDVYRHMPNQWEMTASVKQHFNPAYIESLTDAERQAIPFIGRGK